MLIIILLPATALMAAWFILLGRVNREDWAAAAYSRVLDDRRAAEKLRAKAAAQQETLSRLPAPAARVMRLFLGGSPEKKLAALERECEVLQSGNLKSLSLLPMPGYVLQRRFEGIGRSAIHRTILTESFELYGKKHAERKTEQLLARLLSYPMLGVSASLTLGALALGLGSLTAGVGIAGVGTILVLVLVYAMYDELSDQVNKRREAIGRQFPNVISKLALLVTSGMIMDKAWKETAASQNAELYLEMRRTADELDNLVPPEAAYAGFIDRCNTKETAKLASAILQNLSKGNAEIGSLFKEMAREAWRERRHTAKRDSEKANSKLMIPTMLLFIAILVMLMVPVAMNFASL